MPTIKTIIPLLVLGYLSEFDSFCRSSSIDFKCRQTSRYEYMYRDEGGTSNYRYRVD